MSVTTDYRRVAPTDSWEDSVLHHGWQLHCRYASGAQQTLSLRNGPCRVGDAADSTVQVAGAGTHCVLIRGPYGVVVRNWSGEATINGRTFRESTLRVGDQLAVPGCRLWLERSAPSHRFAASDLQDGFRLPEREVAGILPANAGQQFRLSRPQAQRLLAQLRQTGQREQWLRQQLIDQRYQVDRLRQELDQQQNRHVTEQRADAEKHRELKERARRRAARRQKMAARKLRQARHRYQREHERLQRRLARYREFVHRQRQPASRNGESGNSEDSRQKRRDERVAELESQVAQLQSQAATLEEREAALLTRERDLEVRLAELQQQQQRHQQQCEELQDRAAESSQSSAEGDQQQMAREAELERWQGDLERQQRTLADAQAQLERDQQQVLQDQNSVDHESRQRLQGLESSLADARTEVQRLTDQLSSVLAEKELTSSELQTVKSRLQSLSCSEQEARESLAALQAESYTESGPGGHETDDWQLEREQLQNEVRASQQSLEEVRQQDLDIQRELEQLKLESQAAEESWATSRDDRDQERAAWQQERSTLETLIQEQQRDIDHWSERESVSRQEVEQLQVEMERLQAVVTQQAGASQTSVDGEDGCPDQSRSEASDQEEEVVALREQLAESTAQCQKTRQRLTEVIEESRRAAQLQDLLDEKCLAWDTREKELTEQLETLEQLQLRAENERSGWAHEREELAHQYEQKLAELTAEQQQLTESARECPIEEGPVSDEVSCMEESEDVTDQHDTLIGLDENANAVESNDFSNQPDTLTVVDEYAGEIDADDAAGQHDTVFGFGESIPDAAESGRDTEQHDTFVGLVEVPDAEVSEDVTEQHDTLVGFDVDRSEPQAPETQDADEHAPTHPSESEEPDTASILAKYGFQEDEPEDQAVDNPTWTEHHAASAEQNPETMSDSELRSLMGELQHPDEDADAGETAGGDAPSADLHWTADDEDDSAEHDDSIEAYMQRLLGRKWKNSESPPDELLPKPEPVPSPRTSADLVEESPRPKPCMPPKRAKPMTPGDLSAMRELANASTRDAIKKHARSQRGWKVVTQLATSIIPFLSGVILVILGQSLHVGLMVLGAVLMLASIGISIYQYRKWSRSSLPQPARTDSPTVSPSDEPAADA